MNLELVSIKTDTYPLDDIFYTPAACSHRLAPWKMRPHRQGEPLPGYCNMPCLESEAISVVRIFMNPFIASVMGRSACQTTKRSN